VVRTMASTRLTDDERVGLAVVLVLTLLYLLFGVPLPVA
jgi:hypothetical protein